ncbi:MAG: class I SAM-dependent methyltransferase [Pseudomonadota bacterium]
MGEADVSKADPSVTDWSAAHKELYARVAAGYDRQRSRAFFEKPWLDRLLAQVPTGGEVLELGCGAGEPVTRYLAEAGCKVTALDFAAPMLAIARERLPGVEFVEADMRELDLGKRFHGIVGWDSFFHLTEDEQRALLPRLAAHLAPGGGLLLTVGDKAGRVTGTVEGETVHHASLAFSDYARLLDAEGCEVVAIVARDARCDFHSILLAARR